MDAKGVYYGLVEAQNLRLKEEDQNEVEEDEKGGMMSQSDIFKMNHIVILEIPAVSRVRSFSERQSHASDVSSDNKEMDEKTDETTEVNLFISLIQIIVSQR